MKQGWRTRTGDLAVDSGYASVMAAVDAFEETPPKASAAQEMPAQNLEELLAHLFSLRMTVSEATAELQEAREALDEETGGKKHAASTEDVA